MVILYFRFPTLMRKRVKTFKKINNIPDTVNIMKNIFSNNCIKINDNVINDFKTFEKHMKIGNYYKKCMIYYKTSYLKLSNEIFLKNKRIKYQSFTELMNIIHILKHKFNFDEKFVSINLQKIFNVTINMI